MARREFTKERLLAFIESHSERITETGCQIWMRSLSSKGYCQIWVDGRLKLVHRTNWELRHGPIPEGLCVLHRCDIPCCVNPDHMFLGTKRDNAIDAVRKGRAAGLQRKGEGHHLTDLTNENVIAIRADPRSYKEIAKDYPVGAAAICLIKGRKTWKHI